jgi:hypothetical protein
MADRWLAYERSGHELAFSALVLILRVLAITLPVLLMAIFAAILGGHGDPDTPDLARLLFL